MGIHQPRKIYSQRTIQSAVMIPYLFPTCKNTVLFIYLLFHFQFSESFDYCVLILYERIILLPFSLKWSHVVGGVDVSHRPKTAIVK